jgi:hypothetical protein
MVAFRNIAKAPKSYGKKLATRIVKEVIVKTLEAQNCKEQLIMLFYAY